MPRPRSFAPIVALAFALVACQVHAPRPDTSVPPAWSFPLEATAASAAHGMVVTDSAIASRIGADVLIAGGNAVDATVATAFALAVCLPEAGNLGGGGFAVIHTADGKAYALDFREMA